MATKREPEIKIPAALEKKLTELARLEAARRPLKQKLTALDKEIDAAQASLLEACLSAKLDQVRVKAGLATVVRQLVPQVDDWAALYAHVKKTGAFELLQRRVSTEAWRERLDAGAPVPGTTGFQRVAIKFTPASK